MQSKYTPDCWKVSGCGVSVLWTARLSAGPCPAISALSTSFSMLCSVAVLTKVSIFIWTPYFL